ncbi:MAG: twin-arginine translocase subunit TatB [Gammaproteobacteria bacterium]|nr:MAG: twin-arginine translocase subunit TatB [Gammaproteobacteria bacterium]RLA23821.1 MAG: twin-arginine translocase subunit TatB [Gammaproteobacteria bacterium]
MFDIGFWELAMIGIVALLVIGPERLPKVARVGGFWLGKARGYVSSVKQELSKELEMEELKQSMLAENPIEEVNQLTEALHDEVRQASESLRRARGKLQDSDDLYGLGKNRPVNKGD